MTSPTEQYFDKGLWGWDGTQWRKLGILDSFYASVGERKSDLNAAAGANVLQATVVPAGEVWVVEACDAMNATSASTKIYTYASKTGVACKLGVEYTPAAGRDCLWSGKLALFPGERIVAGFEGCTAGDDLYFDWWGHSVKVT